MNSAGRARSSKQLGAILKTNAPRSALSHSTRSSFATNRGGAIVLPPHRPLKSTSARNYLSPFAQHTPPSTVRRFHSTPKTSSQPNPQYTYRISASYSAKGQRLNPERNLYNFNPFHRVKRTATELQNGRREKKNRPQSGQDAFFVSNVGDTGSVALGVVDGVGGWIDSGVDPADFAHALCDYMASAANAYPEGFKSGRLKPKELLDVGYQKVIQDKTIFAGGSTACIATAEPTGLLEVANLGDSGFLHLGLNAVRFNSPPQTHAFNTPYQLSKLPPRMLVQMAVFGGAKHYAENPNDANVTNHQLKHGDVLIFATDGVWDNLSPQDALRVISRYMNALGGWVETENGVEVSDQLYKLTQRSGIGKSDENTLQALLAVAIAREAKEASLDKRRDGPFAREVHKHFPLESWQGGKADDICAIVAVVVEERV